MRNGAEFGTASMGKCVVILVAPAMTGDGDP